MSVVQLLRRGAWQGLLAIEGEAACTSGRRSFARLLTEARTNGAPSADCTASHVDGPDKHALAYNNNSARRLILGNSHGAPFRTFSSSTSCGSSSAPPTGGNPSDSEGGSENEPIRITLRDAVLRLADAAVAQVEAGDLDAAISILKEGIKEFGPRFPDSPEVGELHNQAALLLHMQNKVEEAAEHAQVALDVTSRAFGDGSLLTGHRLLRLGAVRVGQGQLSEALGLLQRAAKGLGEDPSRVEAELYLQLITLFGASDASQVRSMEPELLRSVTAMKEKFGADSLVLGLALAQHDRVVNQALGATQQDQALCEALMKQHARLLELLDPNSEDLAIANYKLATFFYTQDLLQDAGQHVRKAAQLLRARYPDDHPLMNMCTHRLGMICAASGDHRAASKLLQTSRAWHQGQEGSEGSVHALAKEAELGLAMAKFRAIDPQLPREQHQQLQQQALAEVRMLLEELTAAIGSSHMLAQGGMRYFAQMSVMAKRGGK